MIRNKHDWHVCFFFPYFFLFFFKPKEAGSEKTAQRYRLPGPEGHVCVPLEGMAGGTGGEGKARWRQQDHRPTRRCVGVLLGWFSRSVLHNQPAKSTFHPLTV